MIVPIDAIDEKNISIHSPSFRSVSLTFLSLTGAVNAAVRRKASESAHILRSGIENTEKMNSIVEMINMGGFDFSKSETDGEILAYMKKNDNDEEKTKKYLLLLIN